MKIHNFPQTTLLFPLFGKDSESEKKIIKKIKNRINKIAYENHKTGLVFLYFSPVPSLRDNKNIVQSQQHHGQEKIQVRDQSDEKNSIFAKKQH